MLNIRELPMILLKQFHRGGIFEEFQTPCRSGKREAFFGSGEYDTLLVAQDNDYPELGKEFHLFYDKKALENGKSPRLEIHALGQQIEHDPHKGDLYEDHVFYNLRNFSDRIGWVDDNIIELSHRIVLFALQLIKSPGFEYSRYRIKHESNYPVIVSRE